MSLCVCRTRRSQDPNIWHRSRSYPALPVHACGHACGGPGANTSRLSLVARRMWGRGGRAGNECADVYVRPTNLGVAQQTCHTTTRTPPSLISSRQERVLPRRCSSSAGAVRVVDPLLGWLHCILTLPRISAGHTFQACDEMPCTPPKARPFQLCVHSCFRGMESHQPALCSPVPPCS